MAVKKLLETRADPLVGDPKADPAVIMVGGQRESMQSAYQARTGSLPPLEDQGNDTLTGTMYKEIYKGQIPTVHSKSFLVTITYRLLLYTLRALL